MAEMSLPAKESRVAATSAANRRSTRLSIGIPIAISGTDREGNPFKENTRTVVINKQGAKVVTTNQLSLGAEILIENRALKYSGKAMVVWIGDRRSAKEPVEMGVQLLEASNIWGIEFPPEDWNEGPPIGVGGVKLDTAGAMSAPTKAGEAAPPPKPEAKPPERAPAPSSPRPVAVSAAKQPGIPQVVRPPEGRPAPPPPYLITPNQISAAQEAALARFFQQAQATADDQIKSFVVRLAKLTNEMGIQMQNSLNHSASEIEAKMVRSLDQHIASLLDRLESSRAEVDALLSRVQEVQQSGQSEIEKTQRNIQEAGWQALQAATEQLSETVQTILQQLSRSFLDDTRNRIEENAASIIERMTKESRTRMEELSSEFGTKLLPEMQARQEKHRGALLEQLQREADEASERAVVELHAMVDRSLKEASETVNRNAATAAVFLGAIEEKAKADLENRSREFQESTKNAVETAENRLTELSAATRESLKKELKLLSENQPRQMPEAGGKFESPSVEGIRARMRTTADKLVEESTALLNQRAEKTILMVAEKLKEQKEIAISEASEALRARLAEVFTSVLQPGSKKVSE